MSDVRPHAHFPRNDLHRLQRMATTAGCFEVGWTRALEPTSRRLAVTVAEAELYVVGTVQRLALRDFVASVLQSGSWFDVYALYRDTVGWYVKIGETEDGLLVMSHHEPERGPLRTMSGSVIDTVQPVPGMP